MQTQWLAILLIGFGSSLVTQSVWAETELKRREVITADPNIKVTQLSDRNQPATTVDEWLTQIAQASVVQITGVQVNSTDAGLEIVLETAAGQLQTPATNVAGNSLIADIPNAVLTLPNGEQFQAASPVAGITSVSLTRLPDNRVRLAITGSAAPPTTEVRAADQGLVVSVTPSNEEIAEAEADTIQVVVTGEREDGYSVPDATTATRTDTPLRDIPQSIQVVPQEVIEDQQITRISDAARNVSGVSPLTGFSGTFDDYTIRGFTNYNVLRNGFRFNNFYTYGATVDRIEVLKGPASVLYGQFEPGGVVNYVTKQPLSNPYYSAEFTTGSYSFYRPAIDISGPLTAKGDLLYRLNVAYENSGSFRDVEDYDVFSISPVIAYKPSENTTLTLEYEYTKREGGFDRGFRPSPIYLTLPISRNLGEPDLDRYDVEYHRGSLTLDHRFSENLQLRSLLSAQSTLAQYAYINFDGLIEPDGRTLLRTYNESSDGRRTEDYSWQTDLIGTFNTGTIAHQLLLGLELSRNTDVYAETGGDFPAQDIFAPVYGFRPTNLVRDYQENTRTNTTGIYLQDQVTLLPNLKLLIGGRYDFVDRDSIAGDPEDLTTTEFSDTAFSPRVGLVYQPIEPISLYASYSRSFVPNNDRTATGEPLEPSRGTQYEAGIKAELFDGRLSATLAAYEITKTNIPTVDPNDDEFSIAVGEAKSRGIELDITGEILPGWKVIASAYLNDAFVSEDNDPTLQGNRLENAAYHGASLWTTYEIQQGDLQGLGFGAGLFFVGDRIANQSDPFTLPSYVRADAAIFYERNNWRAALNFKNLFDERYYDTNGFIVFPQAPFTVLGTFSLEF